MSTPAPTSMEGVSFGRLASVVACSLAVVSFATVSAKQSLPAAPEPQMLKAETVSSARTTQLRATPAYAAAVDQAETPVFSGVDVVAYFALEAGSEPVMGSPDFAATVHTADAYSDTIFESTFWFATPENQALFESDPGAYAPRFGGFCSYGITSEYATNSMTGMDVASPEEGWPWARDYLGPPADVRSWLVRDNKLYFTFLPDVMDVFEGNYDALAPVGEARWADWFGDSAASLSNGPFNADCMASGYHSATPGLITRTCTLKPQQNGLGRAEAVESRDAQCSAALDAACGANQGNDPVAENACSECLFANFEVLKSAGCDATATALATKVDKQYCW